MSRTGGSRAELGLSAPGRNDGLGRPFFESLR